MAAIDGRCQGFRHYNLAPLGCGPTSPSSVLVCQATHQEASWRGEARSSHGQTPLSLKDITPRAPLPRLP